MRAQSAGIHYINIQVCASPLVSLFIDKKKQPEKKHVNNEEFELFTKL